MMMIQSFWPQTPVQVAYHPAPGRMGGTYLIGSETYANDQTREMVVMDKMVKNIRKIGAIADRKLPSLTYVQITRHITRPGAPHLSTAPLTAEAFCDCRGLIILRPYPLQRICECRSGSECRKCRPCKECEQSCALLKWVCQIQYRRWCCVQCCARQQW